MRLQEFLLGGGGGGGGGGPYPTFSKASTSGQTFSRGGGGMGASGLNANFKTHKICDFPDRGS